MKLMHVVPHLDEEAAGPTQSVMRLCESLAAIGHQVSIHTMAAGRTPTGARLHALPEWRFPPRFGFSPRLLPQLKREAKRADIIHNHSLWSYPNMAAGLACDGETTLVTSPRGTLAPAARARSQWRKRLFAPLQKPAIQRAACLHATSQMELQDIREMGLRHPVILLPNGIDVPEPAQAVSAASDGRRRLLFLGRLHPIKGVEMLLEAWAALQQFHPDWELAIAGKGDAEYVSTLQARALSLQLARCTFHGPVYADAKDAMFRSSELFVLPTHTENFGMAVAEAQARAIPVVTTRGAPWAGLEPNGSGWWIERNLDALVACLDVAMKKSPVALAHMGQNGREWMLRDFEWSAIACAMAEGYRWLLEGGSLPACIQMD